MFDNFTVGNWLTLLGWPVTFVLGILATLLAQKRLKSRKVVSWTLVKETNLISLGEIQTGFGVPIKILVGDQEEADLSTVSIRIGNTGNAEIENITLHFSFGSDAKVHVGRYIGDLGVYRESLKLEKSGDSATILVKHINVGQTFEVEFLVANYLADQLGVDMAEPGVNLHRTEQFNAEISKSAVRAVGMGLLGIRYDPAALQTAYLVEEVRTLRKVVQSKFS